MAISPVITRGFGSFGNVNLLPTRGFTAAEVVLIKIRLAVTGFIMNQIAVSGYDLSSLALDGNTATRFNVTGVLRNE
jgi:hypothetical protein